MIPYFEIPPVFVTRQVALSWPLLLWGLGFFVGLRVSVWRAQKAGIPLDPIYGFIPWAMLGGFLGGHFFQWLAYHPKEFLASPLNLFFQFRGFTTMGALLGIGFTGWIYFKRKKRSSRLYADLLMYFLLPFLTMGLVGCFLSHNHPGEFSDFFLAVRYPGGSRHDLGLYEAMMNAGITGLLLLGGREEKKRLGSGLLFAWVLLTYGGGRFLLEFLRASDLPLSDPRYGGLTPAQYVCAGMVLWGAYRLRKFTSSSGSPSLQVNSE